MIKIDYKIKGENNIYRRIDKYRELSKISIGGATKESAEFLHTLAMEKLQSSLGTGFSNTKWGHSKQKSIENSKYITGPKIEGDIISTTLLYNSPHAAVVEYGGLSSSPIPASAYGHKAWPIGASQGKGIIFSPTFRVQPGYHYLGLSKDSFVSDTDKGFKKKLSNALIKTTSQVSR